MTNPRSLLEGSCCVLKPSSLSRTFWILSTSRHNFYSCSCQYGHKAAVFRRAPLSFSSFLTFSCTFIVILHWNRRRQWQPTPVLLSGKSHGQRSLVGCSPWGRWESDTTEHLHFHFSLSCIGEGNDDSLQFSCLENPRDGGASRAAVYGVTQSRTQRPCLPMQETYIFVGVLRWPSWPVWGDTLLDLLCVCVRMSDAEHVLMCLITICISSSKKHPFLCLAHLCLRLLCLWYWAVWGSLYVLEMNFLWVSSFANISSHSRLRLSFILGFLCCANAFSVN